MNFKIQGLKSKSILTAAWSDCPQVSPVLCWVGVCAMETRDVAEGFAVGSCRALTPFPGPCSLCLPCQRLPAPVWLLASPRYHLQLRVLCLLLAVYGNNVIIAPASCPTFAWGSGSCWVFPKLWGQSWAGWLQGRRIQVYLLAGQEVECEISVCGEGEGKESLGLCVKLLKCY